MMYHWLISHGVHAAVEPKRNDKTAGRMKSIETATGEMGPRRPPTISVAPGQHLRLANNLDSAWLRGIIFI